MINTDATVLPLYGKAIDSTASTYQRFPAVYARWTNRDAHMPPSVIVLDYVPNAGADLIREKGDAFFRVIRAAHPAVPVIFVENPIFPHSLVDQSIAREIASKNAALAQLFERLVSAGEQGLFYVPGEGLIGTDGEATVDGAHFTDLGMMRYVEKLLPVVKEAMTQL